jgi:hypothetical protein
MVVIVLLAALSLEKARMYMGIESVLSHITIADSKNVLLLLRLSQHSFVPSLEHHPLHHVVFSHPWHVLHQRPSHKPHTSHPVLAPNAYPAR